jgi:hypothetical protein
MKNRNRQRARWISASLAAVSAVALTLTGVTPANANDPNEGSWAPIDGSGEVVHTPHLEVLPGQTATESIPLQVATGTDRDIWYRYGTHPWAPLNEANPLTDTSPAVTTATITTNFQRYVYVFITDITGRIWANRAPYANGSFGAPNSTPGDVEHSPWEGWDEAPDFVRTQPELSIAASGDFFHNQIDVAWTGTDRRIYHTSMDLDPVLWRNPGPSIPGTLSDHSPALGGALVDDRLVIYVVYTGTNTGGPNIWQVRSNTGGIDWLPPRLVGDGQTNSSPSIASDGDSPNSIVTVAVQGTNNEPWYAEGDHGLEHLVEYNGSQEWYQTTGSLSSTAPPSMETDFRSFSNGFSGLFQQIIVRGPDGHIWAKTVRIT